ncbi:MAG: D-hexose-6-phosphate mutarotase [Burkholderiaceae bacterium]
MNQDANGMREMQDGIIVTRLQSPDGATALIADHGAHLLSWCPAGVTEAIFLSQASRYGAGNAIRGGVPVIFPQFGERGRGKRHGIARIRDWQFVGATLDGGYAQARWMLQGKLGDDRSAIVGPGRTKSGVSALPSSPNGNAATGPGGVNYLLTLDVRLAGDLLELVLTVANPLPDPRRSPLTTRDSPFGPFSKSATADVDVVEVLHFHAALHTYLRIPDIGTAGVTGLRGRPYIDQVRQGKRAIQSTDILALHGEIDRIYPDAPPCLSLHGPVHTLGVEQTGFFDTVLWNPGAEKAAGLSDLHAGGYHEFICIEAAAVMRPISLLPGERWQGMQRLRVVACS